MSVENLDSSTTKAGAGFLEKKERMNNLHDKTESGSCPSSPHANKSVPPTTGAAVASKTPNDQEIDGKIAWMKGMDVDELLRLVSFSDVPFLASLLAVSSWSSLIKGQPDRSSGLSVGELLLQYLHSRNIARKLRSTIRDFCTRDGVYVQRAFIHKVEAYLLFHES